MRNHQLRSQGRDPAVMSADELSAVPVPQMEHAKTGALPPIHSEAAQLHAQGSLLGPRYASPAALSSCMLIASPFLCHLFLLV